MFRINRTPIQIERYPDETPRVMLNITADTDELSLEWFYEKDEEMLLFFIVRHLREQYKVRKLTLYMPYIPHARMDRLKTGEKYLLSSIFANLSIRCVLIRSLSVTPIQMFRLRC